MRLIRNLTRTLGLKSISDNGYNLPFGHFGQNRQVATILMARMDPFLRFQLKYAEKSFK